jgi:hypothetical protein
MLHSSLRPRNFAISDIISLICGLMEVKDLVNLLTVSRNFFHCAAPHVWRDISNAWKLFDLLPFSNDSRIPDSEWAFVRNTFSISLSRL